MQHTAQLILHSSFLILYLNNFYPLLLTKLQSKIFQSEFLNFTTACHRKLLHKEDIFRYLITGNLILTEVTNVRFMHFHPFLQDDKSTNRFTIFLRGNPCYLNILYSIKFIKEFFDFTWIDIFTTTNNHILDTSCDPVISVLIFNA